MSRASVPLGLTALLLLAAPAAAQVPTQAPAGAPLTAAHGLVLSEFAREPMVQNAVAMGSPAAPRPSDSAPSRHCPLASIAVVR